MANQKNETFEPKMIKMKIGQRLATERKARKFNQAEMADFLDVPPATYSRIERDESAVDLEDVLKFSHKLNIPIQEFLPDMSVVNGTNHNGQIGLVMGNVYNYSDKETSQAIQLKDKEIAALETRLQDKEETIAALKELVAQLRQQIAQKEG